ncbi:MAG: hypothetical protein HWE23_07285 [Rhodobacteraceae bacterium]|nr:hypothetical protein [Paracoccaceae bacterium]
MTKDITTLQERPEKPIGKSSAALAPELDPSRYMSELEDFDLSEAEKVELLEALWLIMYSFVRLGFDVKNCGQIFENFTLETQGKPGAIDSSHSDNEEKPSSKNGRTHGHE